MNGGLPVSISYSSSPGCTGPRPVRYPASPAACSGLMYPGVPNQAPARVRRSSAFRRRRVGNGRDAEVRYDGVPAPEHDVLRLDVAMHDALRVRVGQRVGDFDRDAQRIRDRATAPSRDRRSRSVSPSTYGMTKYSASAATPESCSGRISGCCSRASSLISRSKRSTSGRGLGAGTQDLERDRPVVALVAREKNGRHPPRADLALDGESRGKRVEHPRREIEFGSHEQGEEGRSRVQEDTVGNPRRGHFVA